MVRFLFFFFTATISSVAAFPTISCVSGSQHLVVEEGVDSIHIDLQDSFSPALLAQMGRQSTFALQQLVQWSLPKADAIGDLAFALLEHDPFLFSSLKHRVPERARWFSVSEGTSAPLDLVSLFMRVARVTKESLDLEGTILSEEWLRVSLSFHTKEKPSVELKKETDFDLRSCRTGERAASEAR